VYSTTRMDYVKSDLRGQHREKEELGMSIMEEKGGANAIVSGTVRITRKEEGNLNDPRVARNGNELNFQTTNDKKNKND